MGWHQESAMRQISHHICDGVFRLVKTEGLELILKYLNSIFNTYLCVYEHICTCSQSQRTVSFIKSIQSDKLSLLWINAFHSIFLFFLNHFGFSTSLLSFLSNTFSHLFHTLPWFLKWSPTVVSSFSSVR